MFVYFKLCVIYPGILTLFLKRTDIHHTFSECAQGWGGVLGLFVCFYLLRTAIETLVLSVPIHQDQKIIDIIHKGGRTHSFQQQTPPVASDLFLL